jgi:hypothetical protein
VKSLRRTSKLAAVVLFVSFVVWVVRSPWRRVEDAGDE